MNEEDRMNRLGMAVAVAALVAAPAGAVEQKSTGKVRPFVEEAASGGMMEVELGRHAATQASSDRVKDFGRRMVADHEEANDDLKQVAQRDSITLPATMSKHDRQEVDRLTKLHGPAFDRAYMEAMVADHEKDVATFREQSRSAEDPDVKDFATRTLPTLESHLQMARDISGEMHRTTSGTGRRTD
jgi:putative membrane protein